MISKKLEWYEVVQVLSRHEGGQMKEWYEGDTKFSTRGEAIAERRKLKKEYPSVNYVVILRSVQEV